MKLKNSFVQVSLRLCALSLIVCACLVTTRAQTSVFTYQGQLTDNTMAASGTYDFQFTLWDALSGGTQQPQPTPITVTQSGVPVANGVFTVQLDFGTNAFAAGANRFLEISVKRQADASYTTLAPRQPITSTPYAIRTATANAADSLSGNCVGCVTDAKIATLSGSKVTGSVAAADNATALQSSLTTSGTINAAGNPVDWTKLKNVPAALVNPNSSFVVNGTSQQTSTNFNIDGKGTVGALGIGTATPTSGNLAFAGGAARSITVERTPIANTAGSSLLITGGGASSGATDKKGGDLQLAGGTGTGTGSSGNVRIQTAGANAASGTTDNVYTDRVIYVAKAKSMGLSTTGQTNLISIQLTGTNTAGGRIFYTIRVTNSNSQIATESGVIKFLATATSVSCKVEPTDTLSLGTVNSNCSPGFYNPGSQPGVSIFDNVTFPGSALVVAHEVYFHVENESGAPIRLEP